MRLDRRPGSMDVTVGRPYYGNTMPYARQRGEVIIVNMKMSMLRYESSTERVLT